MTAKRRSLSLFAPLVIVLMLGLILGVALGHSIWSPSADKYSTIARSAEATRTVQVGSVSVLFQSVIIAPVDNNATVTIEIHNLDNVPRFVDVLLSLVASSTIDSATISVLTGNPFAVTLAADGSINHILSIRPSSPGYALLDLWVRGELAGSLLLYVVA